MEEMFYSQVCYIQIQTLESIYKTNIFPISLGKEFFVGLSQWTNEAGAKAVANAFPEYPCVPIKVS